MKEAAWRRNLSAEIDSWNTCHGEREMVGIGTILAASPQDTHPLPQKIDL